MRLKEAYQRKWRAGLVFLTAVMQYGLMHTVEGIKAIPLDLRSDKI